MSLPPIDGMMDLSSVRVCVLGDVPVLRLPREAASLVSWWPPWAYRPFDAFQLAREARELLGVVAPKVHCIALCYAMLLRPPRGECDVRLKAAAAAGGSAVAALLLALCLS